MTLSQSTQLSITMKAEDEFKKVFMPETMNREAYFDILYCATTWSAANWIA